MGKTDKSSYISAWRKQASKLVEAAGQADMSLAVPSCPEWNMSELVVHVASLYHFVAQQVNTAEPVTYEPIAVDDDPVSLLQRHEETLSGVFDGIQLDDPAWNPYPQPKTVRTWLTRVQNDTAVHAWDAQRALGRPDAIDTVVAVDGVTELLGALLPVSWATQDRDGLSGVVRFAAEDVGKQWRLRIRGGLVALLDSDSVGDDVAQATGTASDLLLTLWGRIPYDDLDVSGDVELLRHVRNAR